MCIIRESNSSVLVSFLEHAVGTPNCNIPSEKVSYHMANRIMGANFNALICFFVDKTGCSNYAINYFNNNFFSGTRNMYIN